MAAREKKLNLTEREGVLGVIISKDEYREYVELQAKRDRSEASMRARMIENNQNALNLSRVVLKAIDKAGRENLDALMGKGTVEDICNRANEILATE